MLKVNDNHSADEGNVRIHIIMNQQQAAKPMKMHLESGQIVDAGRLSINFLQQDSYDVSVISQMAEGSGHVSGHQPCIGREFSAESLWAVVGWASYSACRGYDRIGYHFYPKELCADIIHPINLVDTRSTMGSKVAKSPKDDTVQLSVDSAGRSVISSDQYAGLGNNLRHSLISY
ncbi:hypothetical protein CI102_14525 [Trichoderma harzianum]|nr:hypothetical protein CI102_14525 [Trichoderma harzianum]